MRELENAIEGAVVMTAGERVEPQAFPARIRGIAAGREAVSVPIGTPLGKVERMLIDAALERTGGDKRAAAKLLGVSVRTIYRKLSSGE